MNTPVASIITRALRIIGGLASGEQPEPSASVDAFDYLNDMLDSWSLEGLLIYCQNELIHPLTPNQYIYTIGPEGDVGCEFTASISGNLLTVYTLISGALSVGLIITGQNITSNVTITSLGTGVGGSTGAAIGTYYLNTSLNLVVQTFTGTAPRPIKINSAFVRVTNSETSTLDFPIKLISFDDYQKIGIKSLSGPWPRLLYYQPSEPLGVLNYWQNPSQGEIHLFADSVFTRFNTLQDVINFPQGYNIALSFCLAQLMMPEYGKNDPAILEMVNRQAGVLKGQIKSTNRKPQRFQRIDPSLISGQTQDAGWILGGGFGG